MSQNLAKMRRKIDLIDEKIVNLIQTRFELVKEVAKAKTVKKTDVYQPKREKQMKKRNQLFAKKYQLGEKFVDNLFAAIKTESRRIQGIYFDYLAKRSDISSFRSFKYREKPLSIGLPILEVFKRMYAQFNGVYFLESLGENTLLSRFSLVGFDPTFVIKAKNGVLTLNGLRIKDYGNPFDYLERFIRKITVHKDGFVGGLVGYISYDAVKYFDDIKLKPSDSPFPDFEFGFYEDGLIFDKRDSSFKYFYLREDRSELLNVLMDQRPYFDQFRVQLKSVTPSEVEFLKMVSQAKEEIKAGNSFQVVLARRYNLNIESGSAMFFYERLRELNPSPHMYYLKFGQRELLGSSPELLMRLENGILTNFPLAGTRKRGKDTNEDDILRKELLNDAKEKAEHLMLVDLGRNDLGRISSFGSVAIKNLMNIKKYSHVQHIASEISGILAPNQTMFSAFKASFPMGTVSGAPKIETMKIIDRLEPAARGPYAGAVGYFSLNGNANFALMIRSLFKNKNQAFIQSGAGVVFDSDPKNELKETIRKSQGMLRAIGLSAFDI